MTHNTDLAKGFVGLMGNIRAIGNAFHITSDEVLTWDQIVQCIGAAAGAEPKIVHVASDFIAAFNPDDLGNLIGDKAQCGVFDNTKIRTFVPGYQATMPFAEGVRRSVAWFEKHPERQGIDEAFNGLSERILAANNAGLKLAAK
jgi:nucleoside-diphosphate-sugar epimerase